jgi:hypothetical protein
MRPLYALLLALAACGGSPAGGPDAGTNLHCSGATPTLDRDVQPILRGCGGAELCHGFSYQSSERSRAFLVGQPTGECGDHRLRVAAGDPEHSYLVHKLTDTNVCSGSGMPKSLDGGWHPLPSDKLQTIYDWICSGAN